MRTVINFFSFLKTNRLHLNHTAMCFTPSCVLKPASLSATLDSAVKKGDKEAVRFLLENGLDVNLKDSDDNTCLLRLISRKTVITDSLRLLIEAGASVNHRNRYGESPLMIAALENRLDLLKFLRQAGAEVNLTSGEDNALSIAFHYFDSEFPVCETFECAEYLLDQGADASYVRPRVLHKLISYGNLGLIQKLISAGMAPADDATDDGMNYFHLKVVSPLRSALFWGRPDIARFFKDRLYLTASDTFDNDDFRCLKQKFQLKKECADILNDVTSQPMPLKDLCFVAVSSLVGSGPLRRERVFKLHLPSHLTIELLFL